MLPFRTRPKPPVTVRERMGGRFAVMHVASGLFAQGHYAESEFFRRWRRRRRHEFWMIQAGITKNWFGIGNTSFYGEYGRGDDFSKACCTRDSTSEITFVGLGVVQQIDAAAMELFLGWRRFEVSGLARSLLQARCCNHQWRVPGTRPRPRRCPHPVLIRHWSNATHTGRAALGAALSFHDLQVVVASSALVQIPFPR